MGAHTSLIKNMNPFFLVLCLILLLILARKFLLQSLLAYSANASAAHNRLMRRFFLLLQSINHRTIVVLLICSLLPTLMFEWYYLDRCPVSPTYYETNKENARQVIRILNDHKMDYWVDSASLLNVLRNEEINPWDHDVDFAMIYPGDAELDQLIDTFRKEQIFNLQYLPERGLLQLYPMGLSKGPHADILMWYESENDAGERILYSPEYTLHNSEHRRSDILPLKPSEWLGMPVTIPNEAHRVCREEYGETYMTALVYRLDCLENIIHGRTFF
ncbi:DUF925-domain-containing protein [Balamuthia mandrillaris]